MPLRNRDRIQVAIAARQDLNFQGSLVEYFQEVDTLKQGIINEYPAFENVYGEEGKNLTIKGDTSFNQGYGLEFFRPNQGQVDYGEGRIVTHPDSGNYGVLYNPNEIDNIREGVMGDMLHGMPDDLGFSKLKKKFGQAAEEAGLKENAQYWYEQSEKGDSFDQYWSNDVDGRIRQLFQPGHKEHDIFMNEMSPEMRKIGDNIINYMSPKLNNK